MTWFSGNDLPNVELNIAGDPASYDANGLTIYLADFGPPEPPRLNDTYSLSFLTGGNSAFVDLENKTYEAANPGAGASAQDLMSVKITDVSVGPDLVNEDLKDLTFSANYGAADLPADIKTYLGANQAEMYVSIDYDPANNNLINGVYVTLSPVPEPSPAVLMGAGIVCLAAGRRLFARISPGRQVES